MSLPETIQSIERPHPNLWKLYIVRSVLTGPFAVFTLPYYWFRWHTLRYRFDEQGVSMAWGILFRREINLTYARIQDIHLSSGLLQRWLGLADIQVQTASGASQAEMTIEGLLEYEQVRDFLYERMRGARDPAPRGASRVAPAAGQASGGAGLDAEAVALLHQAVDELAGARRALESAAAGGRRS